MRRASDPQGSTVGAHSTAADLQILRAVAARLAMRPLETVDGEEAVSMHDALRAACDQLASLDARVVARIEADGRWAASGAARTFPEWVARHDRASVGTARRTASLGKALTETLPTANQALASGEMSLEHAQVLAREAMTSDARRAALSSDQSDRNEAHLVELASQLGVDDYRKAVRRWAAAVDDAAHEREHADAVAREYLTMSRHSGGYELRGFLATEHGEVLVTALRAIAGVPAADDPRSAEQRRAAALTDLATIALDQGLAGAGRALVRPHLSVHVDWATFARLAVEPGGEATGERVPGLRAAELDDGTPIPPSVLARIACDSELTRIVFGPAGEPLDVGRAQRTYTGAQRRAVIARDRECRYPGCGAPPGLGEVHHARWWQRDLGPTSVENGVLLCWYHHDVVHRRTIAITRAVDGSWEFRERDGRPIGSGGTPRGSRPLELSLSA